MSTIADVVLSPLAAPTPTAPAQSPTLWALLALARREFEQTSSTQTAAKTSAPEMVTSSGEVTSSVAVTSIDAQEQEVAIGRSSLVQKVFVAVLQVSQVIKKLFGVDLFAAALPLITSQSPPWFTTLGLEVERSEFNGWQVWTLKSPQSMSEKYVLALHGGAYQVEATVMHWANYAAIARDTGATVVVPIYPLAPKGTAGTVVPQAADLLTELINLHGAEAVSLYGDSAGAGLALAATQELVRRGAATPARLGRV